jgi:hypothetical protein
MKMNGVGLLLAFAVLAHLGLPEWCCGYENCRYTDTALIEKGEKTSIVRIEGITIPIENKRIFQTKDRAGRGVYCWKYVSQTEDCWGDVLKECAMCVGIGSGPV